jgi:D-sedoheptulose 7-phosphate isomerase
MDLIELGKLLKNIKAKDVADLKNLLSGRDRIYLIGNGGSNAVCSHLAQDYTKALCFPSVSFSDPSRLTCYINDYGRDEAYAKFLEHFATKDSLCILVSSSGNSENIIRAAEFCLSEYIPYIILTGFDSNNKLRARYSVTAKLDFYVPSHDYGIVENLHSIFLHSVI